ncbi:COP1-interacting protein 7 isoform X1 [Solanum pennellii]|uniref:COP1-interacting protein 7 isoform X1 n=1 Tax=Solanum pennellii TaxID=28526 RepID=A0ABM1H5C4_SOLPN|nr:COP1-interacting protein 7 isoform X1 [Solanum pennellii]
MDSRIRLDFALFQLTPTRTRCDLVIFAGEKSEKLASGLLEPFLIHLKSAKDQISKGGYSITLRPLIANVSWFTKATLQRFVKFVSTPEIIERFVSIERDIMQIESEQANGSINVEGNASAFDGDSKFSAGFSKSNGESNGVGDATKEENPKIRLQRVLESRKAVLRKEQAMAYARALVSGFDMDNLDDLISFSNAFGALRLREACIKFMELCNKKGDDGIWMDEVAALQAYSPSEFSYFGRSGITLAADVTQDNQSVGLSIRKQNDDTLSHGSLDTSQENGLPPPIKVHSTEGKSQPMWPNNMPPYMQNYQNPAFQQIPPYPGYMFSGNPSYYPGMPWPANPEDSSRGPGPESDYNWKNKPPSKNKKKYSNGDRNESNNSSSNGDSDDYEEDKKMHHGKKSSRKVVIRNINYIASKRNEQSDHSSTEDSSSDEDGSTDAGSLRKQVEEAVGSWERHHNSTSRNKKKRDGKKRNNSGSISNGASKDEVTNSGKNWDIFQNILMQDADSRTDDTRPKDVQEEYLMTKKMTPSTDPLIINERNMGHGDEIPRQNMWEEKRRGPVIIRESTDEELLFSHRTQEPKGYPQSISSNIATERVVLKSQKEEDWLAGNLLNKSTYQGKSSDQSIFVGDYASASRDDHLKTGKDKKGVQFDDSIVVRAHSVDNVSDYHQQTDIFMVSDIVGAEQVKHSMPNHAEDKLDPSDACEPNDLFMVLGRDSAAEQVSASRDTEMYDKNDVFLSETLKSHTDIRPASADTKLQTKGEGTNKRIGKDLGRKAVTKEPKSKPSVTGSLGRTKSDTSSRIKKSPSTFQKSKADKDEESRKKLEQSLLQRQKRIAERSGATGLTKPTSRKNPATSSTIEKSKPEATNRLQKTVFKSSTIERLASTTTRTAKYRSTDSKTTPSRKASRKENKLIAPTKKSAGKESTKQGPRKSKPSDTKGHSSSEPPQKEKDSNTGVNSMLNERGAELSPQVSNEVVDAKNTEEVHSISLIEKKIDTPMISAEHSIDDKKQSPNKAVKFLLSEVETSAAVDNAIGVISPLTSSVSNVHLDTPVCQDILSNEVSTPPPNNEMNFETNQGRRKWTTDESSLRVTKGFRKLLYFGRKN